MLPQGQQTAILVQAWEAAVEGVLEDGLITMDEENALNRYIDHFDLNPDQLDRNGVLAQTVKATVIRDIAEGIVPDRQNITVRVPFILMKSEKLVWVMTGVDYLEVITLRERRGSSHRLNIQVTRRVYYRPGTFRSRKVEWRKPSTPIPDSRASPPSTSTSQRKRRSSELGATVTANQATLTHSSASLGFSGSWPAPVSARTRRVWVSPLQSPY